MWIIANQMNTAYEMLERWGYDVIDMIIWVKIKNRDIYLTHGYYFMHSFEVCLVGYKCPPG
jgi:mRNA (2'-O-methyladenosine-N6-)-methyltransferase